MIREIKLQDAQCIATIYNYYIQNTAASFEESPITENEMRNRISKVVDSKLPWLVAEEDGTVIGYAYAAKWNERSAYRFSAETTVYLSHTVRSNGWGTQLYSALFDRLKKLKFHCAMAGITLPNPASVALHEKFGMQKVAHYQEVGYKFEQWHDVAYWQVQLSRD